jgi:uncharacterized ion transporter superfamily protein YfcC
MLAKMKNIKLPDTIVLLFMVMILMAALTWILDGGEYAYKVVNGRNLIIPDSYQAVKNIPQGVGAILKAPISGFIKAANIIAFILIVGGAFFVIQKSGAIDAFVRKIALLHHRSSLMRKMFIPLTMIVFSLLGSVYGMSEEVIPFILIFVPLTISLGYDSIVGAAIPFVGAGAGFAGAFLNPFTVGIAQGIAGLPPFSGMEYRLLVWFIITSAAITAVVIYSRRVLKNPKKSSMYELDKYWRDRKTPLQESGIDDPKMLNSHKAILIFFAIAIIMLIVGVIYWDWYIKEIAALFLGLGLLSGMVSHLNMNEIGAAFIEGAAQLVNVAFIIALAHSILIIAADGRIIDALLFHLSALIRGMHPVLSAQLMFVVQSFINVLIPSGSGQAALSMPIMAPLSDILGITRQTAVLAFQFGDGFSNLIIPTSGVTMGVLGLARIPYQKWFAWMLPLQIIFFIIGFLLLIPPVLLNWGI